MSTRSVVLDIPAKILLAEKMDTEAFARELRMLAAVAQDGLHRLDDSACESPQKMPDEENNS